MQAFDPRKSGDGRESVRAWLDREKGPEDAEHGAGRSRPGEGSSTISGRNEFWRPTATQLLEADREALKMQRYEYLQHLLFQRSLDLREKGPGFDAPGGSEKKKR